MRISASSNPEPAADIFASPGYCSRDPAEGSLLPLARRSVQVLADQAANTRAFALRRPELALRRVGHPGVNRRNVYRAGLQVVHVEGERAALAAGLGSNRDQRAVQRARQCRGSGHQVEQQSLTSILLTSVHFRGLSYRSPAPNPHGRADCKLPLSTSTEPVHCTGFVSR